MTACNPSEKYGILKIKEKQVVSFEEKPMMKETWVNGGFFVLEPNIFDYIKNEFTVWEKEPMINLTKENQLNAFKHNGFYQHMDTIKEKNILNELWNEGNPKWKVW